MYSDDDLFICDENGVPLLEGDLTDEQRKLTVPRFTVRLQPDKPTRWVNGVGRYEPDTEME